MIVTDHLSTFFRGSLTIARGRQDFVTPLLSAHFNTRMGVEMSQSFGKTLVTPQAVLESILPRLLPRLDIRETVKMGISSTEVNEDVAMSYARNLVNIHTPVVCGYSHGCRTNIYFDLPMASGSDKTLGLAINETIQDEFQRLYGKRQVFFPEQTFDEYLRNPFIQELDGTKNTLNVSSWKFAVKEISRLSGSSRATLPSEVQDNIYESGVSVLQMVKFLNERKN